MNVIVTGASRGIGKAVALQFAAAGHALFLTSRGQKDLYDTMQEIINRFPHVTVKARPADLSVKEECQNFGSWVLDVLHAEKLGKAPDVLVNNAGIFAPGGVNNEPDGALEAQIASNVYSA